MAFSHLSPPLPTSPTIEQDRPAPPHTQIRMPTPPPSRPISHLLLVLQVVYGSDMVARTCVHTIQALALEMEASKEEVFAGSGLLSWARSKGALDAGGDVVAAIFKFYALKVCCGPGSGMGRGRDCSVRGCV